MKFRFRTINAGDAVWMIQDNPGFVFEFYRLLESESVVFGWHGATNDDPTSPPIASAVFSPGNNSYAHFDFKDTPAYMEILVHSLVKIGWHSEATDPAPVVNFRRSS